MTQRTRRTFGLILFVGIVMWVIHMNRDVDETTISVAGAEVTDPTALTEPSPTRRPASLPPPLPPQASQISGELDQLEQQLLQAREDYEQQRQRAAQLQAQAQSSIRTPANDGTWEILNSQNQVQNYTLDLNGSRAVENEINRRAQDTIRAQSSQAQVLREQIDENIREQEAAIRQTQEGITYWQLNANYINEQQAQLENLRATLELQLQQLALMREQRLRLSSEVLNFTQGVQEQKDQELADLNESRREIQQDIESLRDSIIRTQQSQRQNLSSQLSLSSQLRQSQQNLQEREQQIHSLESEIESKKQQLRSFVE